MRISLVALFFMGALGGCTALGTFQTPDVAERGHVTLGGGLGLSPSERYTLGDFDVEVPYSPIETYVRVGVLPRVEVGARLGFVAAGLDAKVGLLKTPFLLSLAGGLGGGWWQEPGLKNEYYTRYGALLLGKGALYGGVKLTDYQALERLSCDSCSGGRTERSYTDVVSAVTLGYVSRTPNKIRPILEFNRYFLSDSPSLWVINLGFQVRL